MATASKPDALHFTGNEEADRLLAREPLALLIGFALDQQVPVQTAFTGPLKVKQRLGTLEPGRLATTDPAKLEAAFREARRPSLSRDDGATRPGSRGARRRGVRRRRRAALAGGVGRRRA